MSLGPTPRIFEKHPRPWKRIREPGPGTAFKIVDRDGKTVTPTKQFFKVVLEAINGYPPALFGLPVTYVEGEGPDIKKLVLGGLEFERK